MEWLKTLLREFFRKYQNWVNLPSINKNLTLAVINFAKADIKVFWQILSSKYLQFTLLTYCFFCCWFFEVSTYPTYLFHYLVSNHLHTTALFLLLIKRPRVINSLMNYENVVDKIKNKLLFFWNTLLLFKVICSKSYFAYFTETLKISFSFPYLC